MAPYVWELKLCCMSAKVQSSPAMGRGRYTKRCVAWPLSLTTCVSPVTGSRKGLCTPHVQTTDLGRRNCTALSQRQAGEADWTLRGLTR